MLRSATGAIDAIVRPRSRTIKQGGRLEYNETVIRIAYLGFIVRSNHAVSTVIEVSQGSVRVFSWGKIRLTWRSSGFGYFRADDPRFVLPII
jgi:hypothetical protein